MGSNCSLKEGLAPHLGGSVLGLGGYSDPQTGASAAYSLLTKAPLGWSWADKVTYLEKFRPSQSSENRIWVNPCHIFPMPMLSSWGGGEELSRHITDV